jgi:Na+-driven multidrug efflux pump
VQAVLLGRYLGDSSLAAFAAVGVTVGVATRLFNFLVDGISAKVGKAVGVRQWDAVTARIRLSLVTSLIAGISASLLLAILKQPISTHLLKLKPEVELAAAGYWQLRITAVTVQLLQMSISGILQGFNRVATSALINTVQCLLEMTGSAIVLICKVNIPWFYDSHLAGLGAMGFVTLITTMITAVGGLVSIAVLPPVEAPTEFQPFATTSISVQGQYKHQDGADDDISVTDGIGGGGPEELLLPLPEDNGDEDGSQAIITTQPAPGNAYLFDFLLDGFNMFVRSMVLQATFFGALIAASRLGTAALAAHAVINQLWILISYIVDGFAAAGIVLGSRLAGYAHDTQHAQHAKQHFEILIKRVVFAGLLCGIICSMCFAIEKSRIIGWFTDSPDIIAILDDRTWWILTISQPFNAIVFVYDGLMYASQNFAYIRNAMSGGFILVFLPLLIIEMTNIHALWAIWAAKFALNIWRAASGGFLIHVLFIKDFDDTPHLQG